MAKKENKDVEIGRWGTYEKMYGEAKLTERQKKYVTELNKSLAKDKGGKNGKK